MLGPIHRDAVILRAAVRSTRQFQAKSPPNLIEAAFYENIDIDAPPSGPDTVTPETLG